MNSSYFYGLMQDYSRKKKEFENKKTDYEKYSKKLDNMKNYLNNIKTNIDLSDMKFKEGGYVSNGQSLDYGVLSNVSTSLNDMNSDIDDVKSKINIKIEEFIKEIEKYKKLYDEAYTNYINSK